METTAGLIQGLHAFDPMTYTVNGYRQLSVADPVDSRLWVSIIVLACILGVSLAASALSARRNRVYTMNRLYPMVVVRRVISSDSEGCMGGVTAATWRAPTYPLINFGRCPVENT